MQETEDDLPIARGTHKGKVDVTGFVFWIKYKNPTKANMLRTLWFMPDGLVAEGFLNEETGESTDPCDYGRWHWNESRKGIVLARMNTKGSVNEVATEAYLTWINRKIVL